MQSNLFVLENNYKTLREQGLNVRLNYILEYTQKKYAYDLMIDKGDYSEITTIKVDSIIEAFKSLIKAKNSDTIFYYAQLNIDVKINNMTVFEDNVCMEDIPSLKIDIKKDSIIKDLNIEIETYNNFINSDDRIKKIYKDYLKNNNL